MDRRHFLATGGAALLSMAAGPFQAAPFKVKIKKAIIGAPDEITYKRPKAHVSDGVQLGSWNHKPDDARRARDVAEKIGVQIPSLIRAWVALDSQKPEEVDKIVASIETALLAAE